jgi:hypothetical protein
MSEKTYKASCQCGSLHYYFETLLAPAQWRVRKCTCSVCRTYENHIHVSDPVGKVRYEFQDSKHVARRRFATKTADFITCKNCGSYMGAVMTTSSGTVAVLNAEHLVEKLSLSEPPHVSFDGENIDERLARRNTGWTPVIGEV